ncbi:hypothetical protein TNCV_1095311 [Trichonephila clavipes]|nr:hypothetical protein TNCV_1095311 [Trichonephila clavipes]
MKNFANYTSRGYLMNQGILYRYSPEIEEEEAQLVVPASRTRKNPSRISRYPDSWSLRCREHFTRRLYPDTISKE